MAIVTIDDAKLTSIADAIRAKTGETNSLTTDDMPTAIEGISGGEELPTITIEGSVPQYVLGGLGFNQWICENHPEKIVFSNGWYCTTTPNRVFGNGSGDYSGIDFIGIFLPYTGFGNHDLEHDKPPSINWDRMRQTWNVSSYPFSINPLQFAYYNGGPFPQGYWDGFEDWADWFIVNAHAINNLYPYNFLNNSFIVELPMEQLNYWFKSLYEHGYNRTDSNKSPYYGVWMNLYITKRINDLYVWQPTEVNNVNQTWSFSYNGMLESLTFATDNGIAKEAKWNGATIDLSSYVGYTNNDSFYDNYGLGVNVTSQALYDANKDNYYTQDYRWSKYNHDSAVETINSLPDTSAYGTNTIKFKGISGSATDGGAINTLTAEEIAVATAKGWSVSFV